jgi:hypothetical protein
MEIIPGITLDDQEAIVPIIEIKTLKGKNYGEIVFMGDFHLGSGDFSLGQYLQYVKYLLGHPEMKVVGMGDYLEMGSLARFESSEKLKPQIQLLDVVRILEPIKDRIILLLEGNHEERFWGASKGADTLTKSIADALRITPLMPGPERGQLFVVKVTDGKEARYYSIYAMHGSSGAVANKSYQLSKIFGNIHTSLAVHGHNHQIFRDHRTYYGVAKVNNKFCLTCHEQHWLTTGCFVKNLGYAEKKSYPVSKIGAPIVRFYTDKEALEIIDDPRVTYGIGSEPSSLSDLKDKVGIEGLDLDKYERSYGFGSTETISRGKKWMEVNMDEVQGNQTAKKKSRTKDN